jgi:hypothetical protein
MTRMWRGPSERLKAAEADPLWALIHRRNGRLGVACNVDNQSHTAFFYRVEQAGGRCGTWFQYDLGRVEGPDPMFNVLWGSHDFTTPDAELFDLHHRYLLQLADEVADQIHLLDVKLVKACDQFLP